MNPFQDFKSETKLFLIVAFVAVILAIGGVLLLRSVIPTPIVPIEPTLSIPQDLATCSADNECVVVLYKDCCVSKRSINKKYEQDYLNNPDWQVPTKEQLELCKTIRCTDTTANLNYSKCENNECKLKSEPSWADTSDWQTYRNEEFGFEVRYPENFQLNVEKEVITITSEKVAECKTGASGEITEGTYAELQLRFISHSGMSYQTIWKTIFGINFDKNSYDGMKEIGRRDAYYFYQTAEMPIGQKVYLVRQTNERALEIDIDFPGIIFDCKPSLMHGNSAEKLGDQILSTFRFTK